jgi:hypothetical protein
MVYLVIGMAGETSQVKDVNQTEQKGDAPAQENRGAPGDQAVRSPQVDKRIILAIIRVLEENESFVFKYGDIEDALQEVIEDEDEYHKVEDAFYNLLLEVKKLKHIYYIYEDERESYFDRVVVTPIELSNEQLRMIEEVVGILNYLPYEDDEEAWDVVNMVINSLVRRWSREKYVRASFAYTAYVLAKEYGLSVKIFYSNSPAGVTSSLYATHVEYNIEDSIRIAWDGPSYCTIEEPEPKPYCGDWSFVDEEGGE